MKRETIDIALNFLNKENEKERKRTEKNQRCQKKEESASNNVIISVNAFRI